ncbi:MAG: DUF4339 domain-containing protein [Planctomycetes bacterium]|nr:DUF4339 domain-containing protein [Planctomycetota bacterium]
MSKQWFVIRGGAERGPFTAQRLKEMAVAGELRPEDEVRRADMQTPRPASAIKGLFPTEGAAPVATPTETATVPRSRSSPRAPDAEPKPRGLKKLLVIGVGVVAVLFLGSCVVVGVLFTQAKKAAQQGLGEADRMWEAGDKTGSATKYRSLIQNKGEKAALSGDERARVYGRLIDFDVERGDTESAKKLITEAASAKVAPMVTHPEAKKLLVLAEPKGTGPNTAPDDEVFKDRLAARFLPHVAGRVRKYEEETYDPLTGRSVVFSEFRETTGSGTVLTTNGTMKSPGQPPQPLTGESHVRVSNGFVEVGAGSAPSHWQRLIKLGAVAGDEWPESRGDGTYRLVRFDKVKAQGAKGAYELVQAVIEFRSGGSGANTGHVTETVLEWDGGIQSEKGYLLTNGQKKLVRHKRLISSSSE